jgi:hypothetical protein
VENISKNLDQKMFHVPPHFIGRDPLVQDINSWLQDVSCCNPFLDPYKNKKIKRKKENTSK